MNRKFRISFVITGLGSNGAEMMLLKLLSNINRDVFEPKVTSLLAYATLREKFEQIGIPVTVLGLKPGIPDPRGLFKLIHMFRKDKPQLVQTWMYHADLAGGLAAKLAGNIPVVWNIRHSNLDPEVDKKTTVWTAKVCSRISSVLPHKIICCAEKAKNIHVKLGYDAKKIVVIPNGFDLSQFSFDTHAKDSIRAELSIPNDSIVIGLVARYHPQKDHDTFFKAADLLKRRFPNVHFVLCGYDITRENPDLLRSMSGKNLDGSVHLLGLRKDISAVTAAFDIATSSSRCGEAFSNTIGEAMACGVPAVVTDVGDSAYIVGETGRIISPGQPEDLCRAWQELIDLGQKGRATLGALGRQRIQDRFSVDKIARQYEKIYSDILCPNMESKS
ncbi:glycosyltransferase, WbnK-like family [Syntrophotalea carbinolica DSM 2380]|uniref:Glycosyltransferase, WbnK-like family n=1 Tax=Syntrophotalea carbinolica (strain DSM 2380 / NBRC 103641 / GraBd1) TaxID=338963 RepID=Q3A4D8_SYNC1|nr:glycosyltransferase [Syntrophotalea carbinolica]ABA88769.1 glycosyltransferase, WbnK-like family [Syntrophotalea carbinolica DSM 2380]